MNGPNGNPHQAVRCSLSVLLLAWMYSASAQNGCYGYQVTGTSSGGEINWAFGPPVIPPEGCYPMTLYTAVVSSPDNFSPLGIWTIPDANSGGGTYNTVGVIDWAFEGAYVSAEGRWEARCFAQGTSFAFGDCPMHYYYMDQLEPGAFTWALQTACTGGTQRLVLADLSSEAGDLVSLSNAAGANYQLRLNSAVIASGALSTRYVSSPPSFTFDALAPGAYDLLVTANTGNEAFAYWEVPGAWPRFVVPVQGDCGINLPVRLALAGATPLSGTGTLMRDDLRVAGVIPVTEPYTALGYTYVGSSPGGSISPALLAVTGANAVVDWVVVELRNAAAPSVVVESRAGLLQRDGEVMDTNGEAWLNFNAPPGTYHVAVRHRNHLAVRTATPVACGPSTFGVDFTRPGIAYGTAPTLNNSYLGQTLWSGDVSSNGTLKYTGSGNDRDPILATVGSTTPNNAVSNTYSTRDVNMNGQVKYTGTANDRDVILTNVGSSTPNATRVQQVP